MVWEGSGVLLLPQDALPYALWTSIVSKLCDSIFGPHEQANRLLPHRGRLIAHGSWAGSSLWTARPRHIMLFSLLFFFAWKFFSKINKLFLLNQITIHNFSKIEKNNFIDLNNVTLPKKIGGLHGYYFMLWMSLTLEMRRILRQKVNLKADVEIINPYWWVKNLTHHVLSIALAR